MRRFLLYVILLSIYVVCTSHAATHDPVMARNGMVVSAHRLASEAGCQILKDGSNAVDAAVVTAFVLNVVEGYYSGIGGGLFMVLRTPDGRVITIDGRETAPALCDSMSFVNYSGIEQKPSVTGPNAGGVPGTLAALNLALQQFGTVTLADALKPAIAIADTGFLLDLVYAEKLERYKDRLSRYHQTASIFLKPDGSPWQQGDRLVQHDLAATLQLIADHGIDVFYRGDLGLKIAQEIENARGWLRFDDLRNYSPVVRSPVHGQYKGYHIYSMPPPSSGGIHLIQMLNILRNTGLSSLGHNSSRYLHYLAEAMSRAFADRAEYLGDPAYSYIPVRGLLSLEYADQLAASILPNTASHLNSPGDPCASHDAHHTTHISAIDDHGTMVALTTTINTTFGSAWIIPGTGILLNNEMDDFVTHPGEPNFWGLVGNRRNFIESGKRPLSSMTPTLVLNDDQPFMILGSPGGPRIISTVLQVFLNVVEFDMDIQAAVDAPRVHHQWQPDTLYLEAGIPVDVQDNLTSMGHHIKAEGTWSSAQSIHRDPATGIIYGGTDSRSHGAAVGH